MYLKIKLHPDSKDEHIKQTAPDRLEIWVKDRAEANMANRRMLEIIRGYLNVKGSVKIIHGHHSPNKIILVSNEK